MPSLTQWWCHAPTLRNPRYPSKYQTEPKFATFNPQFDSFSYFAGNDLVKSFPANLLRRKSSSDDLYVTNSHWAEVITNHLTATPDNKSPIVELNPGIGILTKQLLERTQATVHCLETQKIFKTHMETLFMDNIDRMTYTEGDLMKMDFRDSLDSGERVLKFLGAQKKAWEDGNYNYTTIHNH